MEFRAIQVSDYERCCHTQMAAFKEAPWNEDWNFEQVWERIDMIMSSPYSRGFVAVANGTVVAMLLGNVRRYMNWKEVFVEDFCVLPEFQGQGVGSRLLDFARKQLKPEGIGTLTLLTERGYPAVKFYEKNGFKVKEDNVFMHD